MDDWLRASAGFILIIDPYAEEFYTYDGKTCFEGDRLEPKSLHSTETLAPRPDLFPGLGISVREILQVLR